jgi:hypothetical protein
MTIDPYKHWVPTPQPPYHNGYQVNMQDLAAGDVELPAISSSLIINGNGNNAWLARFLFQGGQEGQIASNDPFQHGTYPIRVTKLLKLTADDLADGWNLPGLIISLW